MEATGTPARSVILSLSHVALEIGLCRVRLMGRNGLGAGPVTCGTRNRALQGALCISTCREDMTVAVTLDLPESVPASIVNTADFSDARFQ